jgi:4-hydroxy-3-methylbut-2-enyl diphosphate reductase
MNVSIDPFAGFCFGVKRAIEIAETELKKDEKLFCLGEIVHNEEEIQRLGNTGLHTLKHNQLPITTDQKVMFRAHGEPSSTYNQAFKNNIEIIDATCPVVLKFQEKVKKVSKEMKKINGQVVIFGKKNHPEVIGLIGQADGNAIVIEDFADMDHLDFQRPIRMFVQTTKSKEEYDRVVAHITKKLETGKNESTDFKYFNTICGQVTKRIPKLKAFCQSHEVIVFVSGKNSSNGRQLFNICQDENPNSHLISSEDEINKEWFNNFRSAGISGATSTPLWLMERIADHISKI